MVKEVRPKLTIAELKLILKDLSKAGYNTASSGSPEHKIQTLSFFGMQFPIDDYSKLWDAILRRFAMSIEAWQKILENLPTNEPS